MAVQDAHTHVAGRWRLVVTLAVAAALALWFIQHYALRYARYDAASYGDFWPRRAGLIPHIAGGVVAILAGVVQIWLGMTGRARQLHRLLGNIYLIAVATGSAAGFYLALTSSGPLGYSSGLFFLSVAWALTTAMAYWAARKRAMAQHREWMIRSYVVTFAFVFFRLLEDRLVALHVAPTVDIDSAVAWACWAVPLLLAEPLLQSGKLRGR